MFGKWTDEGIYFVTRLKDNAAYEVLAEGPVPANRNILSDQLIQFTGEKAQKDCPSPLRRVAVWDAVNEREIVLLTNLQEFGATTIAAIYKDRWEIGVSRQGHIVQSVKVRPRSKDSEPRSWGGAVARKQDGGGPPTTCSKGVCATHQVATYSERRRSLVTRISGG